MFADPRSPRRKPRKGLIKVPSVRVHRRKGEEDERRDGRDFHRIKFFAASESETRDGLARWTLPARSLARSLSPRRRWIFRRAVDQYYFAKELARNRAGREVVFARGTIPPSMKETCVGGRTSAWAHTSSDINDFERRGNRRGAARRSRFAARPGEQR